MHRALHSYFHCHSDS
jgi:hypothetical protein